MLIYEEIEELASRVENKSAKILLMQAAKLVRVPVRTAKVRMVKKNCPSCKEEGGVVFHGTKKITI